MTDRTFTTLPCNCPPHHVPVCGKNGNTYPSACVAKCTGLQDADIEFGACRSKDPCANNDCPKDSTCVADRNVCLSSMHKPCPQYRCGKNFKINQKRIHKTFIKFQSIALHHVL